MFKKTVEYETFDGEKVSRDFYFHLSKADLVRMAASGSMLERLKKIMASKDNQEIFAEFEEIIRSAVGVRSEDGERFVKDAAAQSTLLDSPAYGELLVELCTNANAASDFIAQLLPEKLQKELKTQLGAIADGSAPDPLKEPEDDRPTWERESRRPTDKELQGMPREELVRAMRFVQQGG